MGRQEISSPGAKEAGSTVNMSERDAYPKKETATGSRKTVEKGFDFLIVSDLMTRDFISIPPDTPIDQCIAHFSQRGCRDLLVVDNRGSFLGVVTPFDLLTQISPTIGVRSRKKSGCIECILSGDASTADDIMARKHIVVHQNTPVTEAIRLLEKYHHPDLVVLDDKGIVIGVLEICSIIARLRVNEEI